MGLFDAISSEQITDPFDNSPVKPGMSDSVPSWLLGADNHNLGNNGTSFLDPTSYPERLANAGKMIVASVLSGANSFYNTGITIGNWFGADAQLNDTSTWINSLDSDLGAYYDKNRQWADLAGFIAGSFVPGIGGIKLLNAGQAALRAASAGEIGTNMARVTGLLAPSTSVYTKLAAREIAQSTATFSSINANTLKALAAGVQQNVLEGAAFETAVQATMFKSPVLEDQDRWDIVKNIATAGALQGAIGGVISAVKTFGEIKAATKDIDLLNKPYSSRTQFAPTTPDSEKIILAAEDKATTPPVDPNDPNAAVQQKLADAKTEKINNFMRTSINNMDASGNKEVTNMIADAAVNADSQTILANFLHAEQIGRVSNRLGVEVEMQNALNKTGDIPPHLQVGYVKLTGENAGRVTYSSPQILNLADTVSSAASLYDKVRSFKFSTKVPWNAADIAEAGGVPDHMQAEARYIWAQDLLKGIPDDAVIHENDFPLLERAFQDGKTNLKILASDGSTFTTASKDDLWNLIVKNKENVAADLMAQELGNARANHIARGTAISKIVNTTQSWLEGVSSAKPIDDLMAMQSASAKYSENLVDKGLRYQADPAIKLWTLPSYAKVSYRTQAMLDVDGHTIDALVWLKEHQKAFEMAADNVFANHVAADAPKISDAALANANRYGAGPGLFSFANGGYGTLEATVQQIGKITKDLKDTFRRTVRDNLTPYLYALGQKQEAAIEFDSLSNQVAKTAEHYILDYSGEYGYGSGLVAKKVAQEAERQGLKGTGDTLQDTETLGLQQGAPEFIPVKNQETLDAIQAHIEESGRRTELFKEINAVYGKMDQKDPNIFRPVRPDPRDYPYFAFVVDPRVTGAGHKVMIHAATEEQLEQMIQKVPSEYKVITKTQAEDFKRARGDYEYERTLNENYIDSDLKKAGVNSQFFLKTDPEKIINDILNWHLRQEDTSAVELMRMKYYRAFEWFEDQGKQYSTLEASKYATSLERVEAYEKNPYMSYVKTALDVSRASEFPLLYNANKLLDSAVSSVVQKVRNVFDTSSSPDQLDGINSILQEHGINNAYYDAATNLLANHSAPKGDLTRFIRTANAIMGRLTIALDPLNAINHLVGGNVLRGAELSQLTDAIKAGNTSLAGDLGRLAQVTLPGTTDAITSPTKLVSNAVTNFFKDDGTLLNQYKQNGWVKDSLTQFKAMLDDLTLKGQESVSELNSKLQAAFEKVKDLSVQGEKYTGNKFVSEFNRFISADVMRQITDLGVQHGVMTPADAKAYTSVFVNRVEGNIQATQRPIVFQGPIGQAIGMFQSYQFNLMQQLFRYVAEGSKKDAAMLLGLQGTMYGLNGMPAFKAINDHVIGNLSGNTQHRDAYDAALGIAGQQAGELLMYGLPSNLLQANLYNRGHMNPRQVTLIPTNFEDVPFVAGFEKFFSALKDTTTRISQGAPVWESMLQGIEHNGISRPLAGLAQTLQTLGPGDNPLATSKQGSILGSNDLMSLATLVRIAGGRPLDEALVNDAMARIQSYGATDLERKRQLAETVKTAVIAGQVPSTEDVSQFAHEYAKIGGKQTQFNSWMMEQYKGASMPRSQDILRQLSTPGSQKMQLLMGGSNAE